MNRRSGTGKDNGLQFQMRQKVLLNGQMGEEFVEESKMVKHKNRIFPGLEKWHAFQRANSMSKAQRQGV